MAVRHYTSDHFDKEMTRRAWITAAGTLTANMSQAEPAHDALTWTLQEASDALRAGKISSQELTKLCLTRIDKLDPKLNAFITRQPDSAIDQARESDRRRQAGRALSRIDGIPLALKDNIDT